MTERDQKTIRIGAIVVAIYLIGFFGFKAFKKGGAADDYQTLRRQAEQLQASVRAQQNRVLLYDKLSELYRLDPQKIKKETLVADASSAIQTAAQQGGIKLGPLRESPGRGNARELTTFQIEGAGNVTSALGLLHKIQTLGFPLVIDSVQFGKAPGPPGQVKLSLTVIILNYENFKEAPNA